MEFKVGDRVEPCSIDWASTPKPAPPAAKTSTGGRCSRCAAEECEACSIGPGGLCDACEGADSAVIAAWSDPYQNFPHGLNDAQVAWSQATRDADYRKRVAALRIDMDRELPRTWRDRMTGERVSFWGKK